VDNESTQSDNELIAHSLRGDMAAFGTLVLRHRQMVVGIAYRVCGDAAMAEDIAQETFIRVWEKLSSYRPGGNFRGWICRIASNLTIDALRRNKPTIDIEKTVLESPGDRPETAALRNERANAVRAAMMRLPVHSRMALVLREYEGLSYREISDGLDIPIGTVKSRLNDARRRLKAELSAYMEG
jgi:RNA polymerase sigma-70 factor (ECF subfamily)